MTATLAPPTANGDSAAYWEAAKAGRLVIRRCNACGQKHFMPRYVCPECWSSDLTWVEASGNGTVHSFSVVRRASDPAFAPRVPYVIAMVTLSEGLRMITNIVGPDALGVRIGEPVRVCFEDCGADAKLPQFERIVGHVTKGAAP